MSRPSNNANDSFLKQVVGNTVLLSNEYSTVDEATVFGSKMLYENTTLPLDPFHFSKDLEPDFHFVGVDGYPMDPIFLFPFLILFCNIIVVAVCACCCFGVPRRIALIDLFANLMMWLGVFAFNPFYKSEAWMCGMLKFDSMFIGSIIPLLYSSLLWMIIYSPLWVRIRIFDALWAIVAFCIERFLQRDLPQYLIINLYVYVIDPAICLTAAAMLFIGPTIDLVCGKTFRRRNREETAEFNVLDHQRVMNIGIINDFIFRQRKELRAKGTTYIDGVRLPFPVYCDPKTARRTLALLRRDNYRFRNVSMKGIFDQEAREICVAFFSPILVSRISAGVYHAIHTHEILISLLLFCYFGDFTDLMYHITVLSFISMWTHFHAAYPEFNVAGLFYIICEEILNELYGVHHIILMESLGRLHLGLWAVLLPATMHLILASLPWYLRVPIHYIWNNAALLADAPISGGVDYTVVKSAEEIAFVADLVRKAVNKDWMGMTLSFTMRAERIQNLLNIINTDSLEEMMSEFFLYAIKFSPPQGSMVQTDVIMLEHEDEPDSRDKSIRYDFIYQWLPVRLKKSPTFVRVMSLIMLICGSQWFQSMRPIAYVVKNIAWDTFSETGEMATLVTMGLKGFYDGLMRIVEHRDFMAFFDMPRDAAFLTDAEELLYDCSTLKSEEEIISNIARARELISRRKLVDIKRDNSPQVVKYLNDLNQYIRSQDSFMKNQKPRMPPSVVILLGGPGGGKTTVVKMLIDHTAVRDNVPRRPGDILNLTRDKFPAAGASADTRFIVCNDFPALYTEDQKNDMEPFEITIQRICDVYPLTFRQASVEDKGKVFSEVKYFFVTLNHRNLRFGGETEKLQRRLEGGVIVDVSVVDAKGAPMKYAKMAALSQPQRNAAWRFTRYEVNCADNFVTFTESQTRFGWPEFLMYFQRIVDKDREFNLKSFNDFHEGSEKCSCGIPIKAHIFPVREESCPWDDQSPHDGAFRFITGDCSLPASNRFKYFDVGEHPFTMAVFETHMDYMRWSVAVFTIALVTRYANWLQLAVFLFLLGAMMLYSTFVGTIVAQYFAFEWERMVHRCRVRVEDVAIMSSFAQFSMEQLKHVRGLVRTYYIFQAKKLMVRIKRFLKDYYKHILAATAALGIYKMYKKDETMLAPPIYASEVDPASMQVVNYRKEMNFPQEKAREWSKASADISRVDLQTVGVHSEDIARVAKQNLLKVVLEVGGKKNSNCLILIVSPEWGLFNKHYLMDKQGVSRGDEFFMTLNGETNRYERKDLRGDDSCEFYLFRHFFSIVPKSLFKWFPKRQVNAMLEIERIETQYFPGVRANAHPVIFASYDKKKYHGLYWKEEMVEGMCSTPVLGKVDGGWFIVGAVAFGKEGSLISSSIVGCSLLSQEWFDRMMTADPLPFIENTVLLDEFGVTEELSVKSELRNVPSPYLQAVGTMPGPSQKFVSDFRKTILYDDMAPLLKAPYGVPNKTSVVVDGEYHSSFTNTFKNVNLTCNLTESEIWAVAKHYVDTAAPADVVKGKFSLSPTTFEEAIFGNSALGIDRIDFKTSCGYYLKRCGYKTKYDLFDFSDEKQLYVFSQEVVEKVNWLHKQMIDQKTVVPPVEMVFKDEIRTLDKLELAKIRLFCVLCFAWNIYFRMLVMPLLTYLLQHPELSESYGGMNAGSSQWNSLANRLREMSNFFDVDFSSFDTSHSKKIFYMVGIIFYLLSLRLGYEKEPATCIYVMIRSFDTQIVKYKQDVFLKHKGMPSGFIMTLIFNSVANSSLFRVAYLRITGNLQDFLRHVKLGTVGDDNVSSVSDGRIGQFHLLAIVPIMEELGYKATAADKSGKIRSQIPFSELTFVKRKFKFSKDLQGYVAPLETDSIYKGMMFEKRQAGVAPLQRLAEVAQGAQREMFLHGKNEFANFQLLLKGLETKHDVHFQYLEHEALRQEYLEGVFRTFAL
jgi:hypothetical protein